jgi:hypothetical protein
MPRLIDIAADMQHQAQRSGASVRELPRGLRLQFTWCGGQKTLTLSRPAVAPVEEEISICRYAFGVPLEAERRDTDRNQVTLRWPS